MIYSIFLLSVIALTMVPVSTDIASEFVPHALEFSKLCKCSYADKHVVIKFADLSPGVAGECTRYVNNISKVVTKRLIKIDRKVWSYLDEVEKSNLIFHESLHCLYDREHTTTVLEDGCPASFMHYQILSPKCLEDHWYEYVDEMFKK